ncbi:MAG: DNA-formamidopyrimidine glycosylase family protein [Myxococcota bacterium]|nr:DNA-formamidopyrimidine glycosylase family protein [Myxococcota bacterium]
MPELAEVEWMVRGLRDRAQGCCLDSLEVHDERLFSGDSSVAGVLQSVGRRAKYIRMDFEGFTLLLHPRMTGRLVWGLDQRARAVFRFRGVEPISFVDPRRFGTLQRIASDEVELFFRDKKLGDEPWPERRDGGWWKKRLGDRRIPIKNALMRQDLVAGLGNIAAIEICWRIGVDPRTRASDLGLEAWEDLGTAVWEHLGVTLSDIGGALELVGEGGDNGFRIYGRGGEPCPRCSAAIERFMQSGRGTYWCPMCQGENA